MSPPFSAVQESVLNLYKHQTSLQLGEAQYIARTIVILMKYSGRIMKIYT